MFSTVVHLKLENVYQKYIRKFSNNRYSYWFSITLKPTALQNSMKTGKIHDWETYIKYKNSYENK